VIACAPRTDFDLEPSSSPKTTIANPAINDKGGRLDQRGVRDDRQWIRVFP